MAVNKEECKALYRELLENIEDLESSTFRVLWYSRLELLKQKGCWWHYGFLKRKAREYKGGGYPGINTVVAKKYPTLYPNARGGSMSSRTSSPPHSLGECFDEDEDKE